MPPLRLLYLTAEPWPTFRADVAVLFGRWLPRYGIQSDLVTTVALSASEGATAWGGGDARLCTLRGGAARRRLATWVHGAAALLAARRTRYDAIQVRDMPVLAAFGLIVARLVGLPFFYWMSYPIPEGQIALARQRGLSEGLMKFLYPWVSGRAGRALLYRFVLRGADHVFVQSQRMAEDLAGRGVAAPKLTPVPMAVDFDAVDVSSIEPAIDERLQGKRVLVYLGTLERTRHIERLFEMMALLRTRVPDARLVLVGDAEEAADRRWLEAQARENGVADAVIWTGWLPAHEAWRWLRAATLGLSPIPRGPLLDVGSPTKVPEYLMFGLPVVCNDNPDQAALIAACGAGRCVPYTAQAFADAVVELLALAPGERAALGAAGRALVGRERNYREIARQLAQRYRLVLGQRGSAWARRKEPPAR